MSEAEWIEVLTEALLRIVDWGGAYPEDIFPEPDDAYLKRAHEVLTANGMTLDRIAAHCMRHVLRGVSSIASEALEAGQPQ